MQSLREKSLYNLSSTSFKVPVSGTSSLDFADHVFNTSKLKQYLSDKSFKQMLQAIDNIYYAIIHNETVIKKLLFSIVS